MAVTDAGLGSVSAVAQPGPGHISDTAAAYAAGKIHSFQTNAVEKAYVDFEGSFNGHDGIFAGLVTVAGTLTVTGNVGIGQAAAAGPALAVTEATDSQEVCILTHTDADNPYGVHIDFSEGSPNDATRYFLSCEDSTTTRAVIYSNGGAYLAGNVGIGQAVGNRALMVTETTDSQEIMFLTHTDADNPYGIHVDFSGGSPDDNTRYFLHCEDSAASRCFIYSDGDGLNHDGTWGIISDATLKRDITPARSQWDDVKALANLAVNYRMQADGPDGRVFLGWSAQDVREVSPGLVMECGEGDESFLGLRSSILHTKGIIALGEAMERIEDLEAELKALKAA